MYSSSLSRQNILDSFIVYFHLLKNIKSLLIERDTTNNNHLLQIKYALIIFISDRDSSERKSEGDIIQSKPDHQLKRISLTRPNIKLPSPEPVVEEKNVPSKPVQSEKV